MRLLPTIPGPPNEAHQLNMPLDTPKLTGLSQTERKAIIVALAGLLMEATASPAEEENDDAHV